MDTSHILFEISRHGPPAFDYSRGYHEYQPGEELRYVVFCAVPVVDEQGKIFGVGWVDDVSNHGHWVGGHVTVHPSGIVEIERQAGSGLDRVFFAIPNTPRLIAAAADVVERKIGGREDYLESCRLGIADLFSHELTAPDGMDYLVFTGRRRPDRR